MTGDNDSDCLLTHFPEAHQQTDSAELINSVPFIYFLKSPPWRTCIGFFMVQSWKMNKMKIVPECKKFGCYISTFADWGSPLLQPDSSSDSIISCYSTRQGVKIEPLMSRQDRLQLLQQSGPHLQQHAALCSKCAELACGDNRASNGPSKRLKFYKLASQYYVYLTPQHSVIMS